MKPDYTKDDLFNEKVAIFNERSEAFLITWSMGLYSIANNDNSLIFSAKEPLMLKYCFLSKETDNIDKDWVRLLGELKKNLSMNAEEFISLVRGEEKKKADTDLLKRVIVLEESVLRWRDASLKLKERVKELEDSLNAFR